MYIEPTMNTATEHFASWTASDLISQLAFVGMSVGVQFADQERAIEQRIALSRKLGHEIAKKAVEAEIEARKAERKADGFRFSA